MKIPAWIELPLYSFVALAPVILGIALTASTPTVHDVSGDGPPTFPRGLVYDHEAKVYVLDAPLRVDGGLCVQSTITMYEVTDDALEDGDVIFSFYNDEDPEPGPEAAPNEPPASWMGIGGKE